MAKGFPDLGLLVPNKKYAGLFIELKADKTKSMTKEQKEWLEKLNSYGYKAVRCNGSEEAIQIIKRYLGIQEVEMILARYKELVELAKKYIEKGYSELEAIKLAEKELEEK